MNKSKWILVLIFCVITMNLVFGKKSEELLPKPVSEQLETDMHEKGYDLPIDDVNRELSKNDCLEIMETLRDIYVRADKGNTENIILSEETIFKWQDILKETERPVTTTVLYSNMENYEKMDYFLKNCLASKNDSVITYNIRSDGGISRMEYTFDGTDMYVLSSNAMWNKEDKPSITDISYTRIQEWKYTENGWFCYKLCVPEYPEVTEVMDGSCLVRVMPMSDENREMSEKYVLGIGYKGTNLLCSNWDAEHMEDLDYNGMYEYLYEMKYQKPFPSENYQNGIPKMEFESLIMEYLPITAEQLRQYAAFDTENQIYKWARLGCGTFNRSFFSTAFPEVTNINENEDGTVTLTVNAVCEMMLCDDAVITHELTVKFFEDGSFHYLGNKILDNGIEEIPSYQYRISKNSI